MVAREQPLLIQHCLNNLCSFSIARVQPLCPTPEAALYCGSVSQFSSFASIVTYFQVSLPELFDKCECLRATLFLMLFVPDVVHLMLFSQDFFGGKVKLQTKLRRPSAFQMRVLQAQVQKIFIRYPS
jgi:hypothetical protein